MEDKKMKQTKEYIKKEFYIDSLKNKVINTISSFVYIAIMMLAIIIVFINEETMPNKSIIIEISVVIIFVLWTIFEKALTNDNNEKIQKNKRSFEEKLKDYKKQLSEVKFIHDSIIKRQQESPFEEFEALLEKHKDKVESLEENIVWIKTNLEIMGENPDQ